MFYCPRCRGIIKSEDKFCPSCGEKINPEVFQEKSTDKEDREKTENEPLKENLITNTSKQKFTVENLKVPLLKNKKFIFSLLALVLIVISAIVFLRSNSLSTLAEGNQEMLSKNSTSEKDVNLKKDNQEKTIEEAAEDAQKISAGFLHTVQLQEDGTVAAFGTNEVNQGDVSSWTDIISVSAGFFHTVGLRADGTVVATGKNLSNECDVSSWTDIVAVSAGVSTIGLRADRTVVATGDNYYGQCDVSSWSDIIAISA